MPILLATRLPAGLGRDHADHVVGGQGVEGPANEQSRRRKLDRQESHRVVGIALGDDAQALPLDLREDPGAIARRGHDTLRDRDGHRACVAMPGAARFDQSRCGAVSGRRLEDRRGGTERRDQPAERERTETMHGQQHGDRVAVGPWHRPLPRERGPLRRRRIPVAARSEVWPGTDAEHR